MDQRISLRTIRTIITMFVISCALTLLAGLGILDRPDRAASDLLYQQRRAADGKIVIIGIDQRTLEELGPYDQWGREVMARLLRTLNASEDCRPAVIGVDVLYAGVTDAEADAALAEAAGEYDNVVTACVADYGTAMVPDGAGEYELDTYAVVAFEDAYDGLRAVTGQAHINAMMDTDGILRHHMLELTLPDGRKIPSMALKLAEMYRAANGEEPVEIPETNGRGFWYLPYCGLPGDMEIRSMAAVLSGEEPADYFDGKIVLIGPYAAGLQDSYPTSIDHAKPMYGVEYHANAVQALLWGEYQKEAGEGVQLSGLFLLLLLTLYGCRRRKVWVSTALWIAFSGGWVLLAKALFSAGMIVHVLWVPVGVTIVYGGCLAANYMHAASERRRVTKTFERYVAPEIVRELLKEDPEALKPGGREREIAVLFVDVRGFTSMSEKLTPGEVVEILNSYLTLIADCILRNGGTLDKFIGDAAMAFWGAPASHGDDMLRAARAALEMVEGSEALSEELRRRFGRTVAFGIGIHTGPAVVGSVGSRKRMDYTAIGDTVNTASRLESNAPPETIYISEEVKEALGAQAQTEPLEKPLKVKGKEQGLNVYKLLGLHTFE